MNWTQYKTLLIGGGICLVLLIAEIFLIMRTRENNETLEMAVNGLASRRTTLQRGNPGPSQRNLDLIKANTQTYADLDAKLTSGILENQIVMQTLRPSEFIDRVKRMLTEIERKSLSSKKGGEDGVVMRDRTFGFGSYAAGNPPEDRSNIPRLVLQLDLVKYFTDVLFDAGISELVAIDRQRFDGASARSPRGGSGFGGFGVNPGQGAPPKAKAAGGKKSRDDLFARETFTIRFRAYEDVVWSVLNQMVASPNLIVIESVSLTNGNKLLWPEPLRSEAGMNRQNDDTSVRDLADLFSGEPSPEEEAAKPATARVPGLKAKRGQLTGGELIEVVLKVSVYRLKDDGAGKAKEDV